jgi:hypothetical protein
LWSGPGRAWLAELRLRVTTRLIVDGNLGLIDSLAAPISVVEAHTGRRKRFREPPTTMTSDVRRH